MIEPGKLADFAVLSADYFAVPEEKIKGIESVLTVTGGKIVYGAGQYSNLSPPLPPVSPDWSPVEKYGGYAQPSRRTSAQVQQVREGVNACLADRVRDFVGSHKYIGLPCDCYAF